MRRAGAPRERTGRTASQQGRDGGAPRTPAVRCYGGRQGRALAHAESAHRPRAASREARAPRVPAAAAACDQTVACGEGAAAGGEETRRAQEGAAARDRTGLNWRSEEHTSELQSPCNLV